MISLCIVSPFELGSETSSNIRLRDLHIAVHICIATGCAETNDRVKLCGAVFFKALR